MIGVQFLHCRHHLFIFVSMHWRHLTSLIYWVQHLLFNCSSLYRWVYQIRHVSNLRDVYRVRLLIKLVIITIEARILTVTLLGSVYMQRKIVWILRISYLHYLLISACTDVLLLVLKCGDSLIAGTSFQLKISNLTTWSSCTYLRQKLWQAPQLWCANHVGINLLVLNLR